MKIGSEDSRFWLVTDEREFVIVPTFGIVRMLRSRYKFSLAFMWLNVHFRIGFIDCWKKRRGDENAKTIARRQWKGGAWTSHITHWAPLPEPPEEGTP